MYINNTFLELYVYSNSILQGFFALPCETDGFLESSSQNVVQRALDIKSEVLRFSLSSCAGLQYSLW